MPSNTSKLISVFAFSFLTACGIAGPGGGSNGFDSPDRKNIGDEDDDVTAAITVEGTPRMFNRSWNASSDSIIVDEISCSNISAIQLNYNLDEIRSTPDLPDHVSVKRAGFGKEDAPGCKLVFDENFDPRIDAVVRAEYPNGDILYAPLRRVESEDQSIVISPASHLVVERLFEQFQDTLDLAKHLPCTRGNADCETQHRAKARLLSFISDTARLYEYEDGIQPSEEKPAILAKLETKRDLITHVDTAINEILRSDSPIAKGTIRESYDSALNPDVNNGDLRTRLSPTEKYNSVFFSMGLISDSNNRLTNKLFTASSQIDTTGDNDILPRLIHNAYYLDYRYDDILPDIPFEMSTLQFKTNNSSLIVEPERPLNRYSFLTSTDTSGSLVNGTHLSTQGFFLNDRAIAQTVTEQSNNSSALYGYDFNPVYYKLYRINEYEPDTTLSTIITPPDPDYGDSPTWLTGTGFGVSTVYDVDQTSSEPPKYERIATAESHTYFSWELHGLRTSEDIDEDDITGYYDVLEFSISMDNDTNTPARDTLLVEAASRQWEIKAETKKIISSQSGDHQKTWQLKRDRHFDFSKTSEQTSSDLLTGRSLNLYESENDDSVLVPNGLITLGSGSATRLPLGHVSENAEQLAFAINQTNNKDARRGIIIASKARTTDIQLSSTALAFTLSGNYFFMDDDTHQLASVNESRLSLSEYTGSGTDDCDATLALQGNAIEHTLTSSDSVIDEAAALAPLAPSYSSTKCTLDDSEVEIAFDIDGEVLTLRGYAAKEDGPSGKSVKLINLLWLQDNALGLVFAQLDQDLNSEFDN